MNKLVILIFALLIQGFVCAQHTMDGLVNAEKSFAAYSVANDVRGAFLNFADSTGVVFVNGKPVNAIQEWSNRQKTPVKLDWSAEYAELAASGDFGFTSGPWTFSVRDTIRSRGYFNSVWHINDKGEWKFLVDLGVTSPVCDFSSLKTITDVVDVQKKGTVESLKQAENDFINRFQKNGKMVYHDFVSMNARLLRNERCVASDISQHGWALDSLPSVIDYKINGLIIASSGDIGCIYGTSIINNKADGYMRIWRKEGDQWKIALEVLRF